MNSAPALETTVDAFHRGRFVLVQPKLGHRAGLDAMLLASALPEAFSGHLADLGAGAGAAAFAALTRLDGATATLVEREPELVDCARAGLAHSDNAHLQGRVQLVEADVTATASERRAAGLADNSFDAVIMNPPYNDARDRSSSDELRARAHVAVPDLVDWWLRAAAAISRPGARIAIIARPESLHVLLDAIGQRYGAVTLLAIHKTADAPAIRVIVSGIKGSRARLGILPPLVLHEAAAPRAATGEYAFTQRADDLINGRAALFEA